MILKSIRFYSGTLLVICLGVILLGCTDTLPAGDPGDSVRGATLFAQGDGSAPPCLRCHCPDASGGCLLEAPSIQGESFQHINDHTRAPNVDHSGGKFNFTDQDVRDIQAFLATATTMN